MKLKSSTGIGGQTEASKVEEVKQESDEAVGASAAMQAEEATQASATSPPESKESKAAKRNAKDFVPGGQPIDEPGEFDVLNGRGASVNAHKGNQRFRALCFQRKPLFEAGSHAAKRRIATEIVNSTIGLNGRFIKRKEKNGPWFELTKEKSILKACQVMRDFERPDRAGLRETARINARKRNRMKTPSTPMPEIPQLPPLPEDLITENPFGVHDHDVLSGRGAFVNGHVGNQRLRKLALERKTQFEAGSYSERRALASEVVSIIRSLEPPGRFLKRATTTPSAEATGDGDASARPEGLDDEWEELSDDKAIHKACQVMRDIDRPDRAPDRRGTSKKEAKLGEGEAPQDASTVAEVVAAAEAALDTVMDGVSTVPPPQASADAPEEKEKGDKAEEETAVENSAEI